MAQLPDEESKQYNYNNNNNNNNNSNNEPITNGFQCSDCEEMHDIGEVFLWSGCQHKYSRGCVVWYIRRQLYDKNLPLCSVDKCNKLLLQEEAQLVLPKDVLIDFYRTQMEYQPPQQTIKYKDDEKQQEQQQQPTYPKYHSFKQDMNSDSSSDGIDGNTAQQILGTVDRNPVDESSEEEIQLNYDRNYKEEQEPLLNNGHHQYGGYSNMDSKRSMPFDCILCNEQHGNDERFEWSKCKHLYGRQCAENMIIMFLFERKIPECTQCKMGLEVMEAQQLLPYQEMQVLYEIYALKASMESFKKDNDDKHNKEDHAQDDDDGDNDNNQQNVEEIRDDNNNNNNNNNNGNNVQIEKNQIDDGIRTKSVENGDIINTDKVSIENELNNNVENNKMENKENKEDDDDDDDLMPSVLVLPDNNYQALIPMDNDFIDDNGITLNAKKEKELNDANLFYCSRCKQLISLLSDINNGKFTALKCQHVTCLECARNHTKHEIEILQTIPSCQVCPESITDRDMIAIWGQYQAKQLMDGLFKEKSLKVPPFGPTIDPPPSTAGNVDIEQQPINDRDDALNGAIVPPPIENNKQIIKNRKNDDDDGWDYCLTEECHKRGPLSRDKNEESRLNCIQCGISWCVRCAEQWHLGQTCEQYQDDMVKGIDNFNDEMAIINAFMDLEQMQVDNYDDIMKDNNNNNNDNNDKTEDEFQKLYDNKERNEQWRTCPICKSVIEKDGGCNYITCKCGGHWCWICEQKVDDNDMAKHYDIGQCQLNEDIINNK